MIDAIKQQIVESHQVKQKIAQNDELLKTIETVAQVCIKAYKNGNKVILAGNGGSAADAQHIAAEFVGRYGFDRPSIPSLALTTDPSIVTAIANDYGYDELFSRQLQGQGKKGDVFIGISTSGNSKNLIKAIETANNMSITSVSLSSVKDGLMQKTANYSIKVPSTCTPRIQESHILIGHILCQLIEDALFASYKPQK